LWLIEPRYVEAAWRSAPCVGVAPVFRRAPVVGSRTRWIVSRRDANRWIGRPDFKSCWATAFAESGSQRYQSLQRLAHHLQGFRLGIALGGGGARGLAHLGVLDELNRAGIVFDLVAAPASDR